MKQKAENKVPRLAYRVGELPAMTGLCRASCYALVARGEIRSVRAGKAILVPAEALTEFLASGR
jgi:excisionase family DNA binding protein